jgi:hypothetical protein
MLLATSAFVKHKSFILKTTCSLIDNLSFCISPPPNFRADDIKNFDKCQVFCASKNSTLQPAETNEEARARA